MNLTSIKIHVDIKTIMYIRCVEGIRLLGGIGGTMADLSDKGYFGSIPSCSPARE